MTKSCAAKNGAQHSRAMVGPASSQLSTGEALWVRISARNRARARRQEPRLGTAMENDEGMATREASRSGGRRTGLGASTRSRCGGASSGGIDGGWHQRRACAGDGGRARAQGRAGSRRAPKNRAGAGDTHGS
jgi:hypothetical protein